MAYTCTTCFRVLDESAKTCPGCGRDFTRGTHVKIPCRHCGGIGFSLKEADACEPCPFCYGTGGHAEPIEIARLITCSTCSGSGNVKRSVGIFFKEEVWVKCDNCDGHGRI